MNTIFKLDVSANHPDDITQYGAVHQAITANRGGSMIVHGDPTEFDSDAIEDVIDQLNQHWEASVEQIRAGLHARHLQIKAAAAQKAADAEAKRTLHSL